MSHGRNTSYSSRMVRVSRHQHCPVCGKPDWCGVSQDGQICICMRVEDGACRTTDNGGYLHKLDASQISNRPWRETALHRKPEPVDTTNWPILAQTFQSRVNEAGLSRLSHDLGVSVDSLKRLWIGWSPRNKAWSFPMRRVNTSVCGIRLRSWKGRKWAVKGSKQGLFIPQHFPHRLEHMRMFVAEGPTDTAALLDLGFFAIGKPSCRGMEKQIVQLAKQTETQQVVIAADHDKPGQEGAFKLAKILRDANISCRILTPPQGIKDIRAWKQLGVTANDILTQVNTKLGGGS